MSFSLLVLSLSFASVGQAQLRQTLYCSDQATSMLNHNKIRNADFLIRVKNAPTGLVGELVVGGPTKGKTTHFEMKSGPVAPKVIGWWSNPAGVELKVDFNKVPFPGHWTKCTDDCEEPGTWWGPHYAGALRLNGGRIVPMFCSVGL